MDILLESSEEIHWEVQAEKETEKLYQLELTSFTTWFEKKIDNYFYLWEMMILLNLELRC